MRGVGMKEVKSNRAWREECEALRCERDDWKVECGHAEALAAKCMAELAAMTAERDMWKETDLRDAKRIDELAEQLAALRLKCDEAIAACDKYSEDEMLLSSQAREQQLREALDCAINQVESLCKIPVIAQALALPHDTTALKQWGAKLLRDAAEKVTDDYAANEIRRMADELEGKK